MQTVSVVDRTLEAATMLKPVVGSSVPSAPVVPEVFARVLLSAEAAEGRMPPVEPEWRAGQPVAFVVVRTLEAATAQHRHCCPATNSAVGSWYTFTFCFNR